MENGGGWAGDCDEYELEDMEEVRDEPEDIKRIAPWTKQITARGIVASVAIGIIYSVIVMKLNLTTGLVPNLNVSAALLAFVFLRTWTKLLSKAGIVTSPFTRQENTIVQTCAVACYSIAVEVSLRAFFAFHLSNFMSTFLLSISALQGWMKRE
uniref:Uncharacterized protein n=1 Tax=Salix viminalis TaxID=40686 RepID=A0A6N2L9M4_SALVM